MKKIHFVVAIAAFLPAIVLAAGPQDGGALFKRWDANGDGSVTRDEAQAKGSEKAAQSFDRLDTNKDGVLTKVELAELKEGAREGMVERLKAADVNGDGSLSRDEVKDMPRLSKGFDRLDANKDGLISPEELQAMKSQMGGRRPR